MNNKLETRYSLLMTVERKKCFQSSHSAFNKRQINRNIKFHVYGGISIFLLQMLRMQ
jgi:hypothetical protein